MATCANCASNALYAYKVNESFSIHYCQLHLPRFLHSQKTTGALDIAVDEPVVPAAPAKTSKKTKQEPVAEPVEETVEPADATDS